VFDGNGGGWFKTRSYYRSKHGSIVGGLYAIGYTADSLEKIVRSIDWDLMLSDNIPENKVIFPEKHYLIIVFLSLPVTKEKIRIPSGLIKGQQIQSALSYYFMACFGYH